MYSEVGTVNTNTKLYLILFKLHSDKINLGTNNKAGEFSLEMPILVLSDRSGPHESFDGIVEIVLVTSRLMLNFVVRDFRPISS